MDEELRRSAFAVSLYAAGRQMKGTAGEYYLAMRGLALAAGIEARFHPACPRVREKVPAIVVLMRGLVDDRPVAVQRIFVRKDCAKDGIPMMLGPAGGAAMKLTAAGPQLSVCEGFETGLALLALGHRAVWALGCAGAIARLPVLAGVEELIICADNDRTRTGEKAAAACMWNWGRKARAITVNQVGRDFADLVRAQMEGVAL